MATTETPAVWEPVNDVGSIGRTAAARETDEASLQFRLIAERARVEWFSVPAIRAEYPVVEEYVMSAWDQFAGNAEQRRRTQMASPQPGEFGRMVRTSNHGRAA